MSESLPVQDAPLSERLNAAVEAFFREYGGGFLTASGRDPFLPKIYERKIIAARALLEQHVSDPRKIESRILVETGYPIRIFVFDESHRYVTLPLEYQGFPVNEVRAEE